MEQVADASVALVVTSPPYFAGKEYEVALGEGGIPATYGEYLTLLEEVFAECMRALEPGGRIAVNVANLGRRPYRSLSADVTTILQDRLRLLLRGEIVWVKADGATNSTAWGSYGSAANPVLRDLTELLPNDAWLTTVSLDGKGVEVTGAASAASTLIPLLENSPRLERVEFSSPVTRGRDNKEQFRIRAAWEPGGTGSAPPAAVAAPPPGGAVPPSASGGSAPQRRPLAPGAPRS